MKNQKIINIVLFVGLIISISLHFTDKLIKSDNNKISKSEDRRITNQIVSVAYVNTDSLMENYLLYQEIKSDLEQETKKLLNDLHQKESSLQNQVMSYQKKVQGGIISMDEAQKTEQNLMQQQQTLQQLSEQYTNKIAQKEYNMTLRILDSVISSTSSLKEKLGYDFVLGYTKGTGILYANPEFDITNIVLEDINKKYTKKTKN